MVRVSGHYARFNDTRSTLEGLGFTLDDVPLTQWHRAGGSADADPASPTIILLDNGPITLMVLIYDLDLDQLTTIADTVEGVDQPAMDRSGRGAPMSAFSSARHRPDVSCDLVTTPDPLGKFDDRDGESPRSAAACRRRSASPGFGG
ncbi:MAG: hypothetical protein WKF58_18065 [Ilumatobacteraceae bacterium]